MPDALSSPRPTRPRDRLASSYGPTDEEALRWCAETAQRAVIGTQRVVIQDTLVAPGERYPVRPLPPKPPRLLPMYSMVKETPLRQEVKAGQQPVTLEVKGKPGASDTKGKSGK